MCSAVHNRIEEHTDLKKIQNMGGESARHKSNFIHFSTENSKNVQKKRKIPRIRLLLDCIVRVKLKNQN